MLLKKKNYEYDITFICRKGECHFAQPILNELEKKYKIQYIFPNHKIEYWHFMVKGKVIWVEWANKFALEVSKKTWKDKKVIVRFHRNEILSEYMSKIKWQNIDKVIFVNSQFEKEFKDKITKNVDTVMIPNAIETKSFPFYEHNYGHSICAYGYAFNPIKGYDLLINMFDKLLKFNPKFHLTIMGMLTGQPSSVRHLKVIKKQIKELNLSEKITIIEKKKVDSLVEDRKNVSEFLSKHDIIMSYSNTESFHYSFAEGMLSGLEGFYNMWHNPLIKEFWVDFGYESEDKLIVAILEWEKLSNKEKIIKAKKNREYILNNFSNTSISKVYEDLFFIRAYNNAKT